MVNNDEFMNQEFEGYKIKDLAEAFESVRNPGNWKTAITTIIDDKDRAIIDKALIFYTGAGIQKEVPAGDGRLAIWSPGYYATIGA